MITPEWLADELNLLNTHKALQESILRDIVRRLIKTDFTVTDTAAWQAEKLQQSGMVFDEIMSEVSKLTGKSTEELRAAFARAKTEIFNYGDDEIKKAGFDVKEFKTLSPAMTDVMTAAVKKTTTEAKNLTKTTALTSQSAYINAADLAHQQVKSGAFTLDEALANAIRSAADGGFTVIYPSGHKSSLDSAMRRALLTGLNQTACKIAEMRADEVGGDLMELSAHFGARPSHAEWQGQIVSRSGRRGYLSLDDIGYGRVDGFMGANCRHDWWVFFEGLSKPRYTKRQLNEYKNATVEYDGETMPTYEAMQKQRSMERKVRTLKQRLVAYDEAAKNLTTGESISAYRAAFDREAKKLKSAEAKIQDFCNQTGIARQKTREQVFAAETVNGAKGFGRSVSGKAVKSSQKSYDIWRKSINAQDTPKTLAKYYDMKYNDKQEYSRLQKYAKMVNKGEVSPLLGYKAYRNKALEIERELVGIKAKDGTVIKNYSAHFVGRVIGESAANSEYNRPGVEIADIKDALLGGELRKTQTDGKGKKSQLFVGQKCKVSLNTNTGNLVQTNAKKPRR